MAEYNLKEPIPIFEPKIVLLDYTHDPIKIMTTAWKAMHKQYISEPRCVSKQDAVETFRELIAHQHKTAFEYVHFSFGLEDVSRAFQQQITRHRVGVSFSIQSLRQVDLSNNFKYVVPHNIRNSELLMGIFHSKMIEAKEAYEILLENMPVEAARGILPLNICSNITMSINYRALFEMANQRFCATTQGEFQDVMYAMRQAINDISDLLGAALMARCEYTKICNQGKWSCGKYPIK